MENEKEKSKKDNRNEELGFKILDHVLDMEQAYGGPRVHWFRQGFITATSIAVFAAIPQYRLLTGTWAAVSIADSLLGLGVVKWAEEKMRKQQEEFLKKYPNPQALVQDLLKKADVQTNKVVPKKDLH